MGGPADRPRRNLNPGRRPRRPRQHGATTNTAVFRLRLVHGEDAVVEADAAGRTAAGEIVLERTDQHGRSERVRTCRADTVTAVCRRGPADGGLYGWIPQPPDGTWWCY